MVSLLADFTASFLLGLATPLTAVCVLPLYPAFISYLSNQMKGSTSRKLPILLGLLVVAGVLVFMLALGLLFTTVLQVSLTNVIGIISPIAFGILIIISILLIFNVDFGKLLPKASTPRLKNPILNSFVFGFFFGGIIIPCNPGFIAAFFTRAFLMTNPTSSILNFLFFGLGIGAPLLVLAVLSSAASQKIINFFTSYKRAINLIAGLIMLSISAYYLVFVFRVFG